MKASDWIDRLKAAKKWESDYRVAQELAVAGSTLSRYRNKPESTMDDDTAVKVAQALAIEPEIVVLDQLTERTRSEPARAALSGLLQRIAGKVLAGGGSGGARGRLDITSVTPASAEGNPHTPRSRQYASCKLKPHPLQQLARALTSALSPAAMGIPA